MFKFLLWHPFCIPMHDTKCLMTSSRAKEDQPESKFAGGVLLQPFVPQGIKRHKSSKSSSTLSSLGHGERIRAEFSCTGWSLLRQRARRHSTPLRPTRMAS